LKVLSLVRDIRQQAPGIGVYKLFLILRDVYGSRVMGRDSFYDLLHRRHLMLPPQKRRHTTNSNHRFRRYKNLIKGYKPTGINMLWVADITYIDTDEGVCYLHLLTDAFTHEIIGWTLSESLVAENTFETLEQAVSMFRKADLSHLIHHSYRGGIIKQEWLYRMKRPANIRQARALIK
jgi:putative transposase